MKCIEKKGKEIKKRKHVTYWLSCRRKQNVQAGMRASCMSRHCCCPASTGTAIPIITSPSENETFNMGSQYKESTLVRCGTKTSVTWRCWRRRGYSKATKEMSIKSCWRVQVYKTIALGLFDSSPQELVSANGMLARTTWPRVQVCHQGITDKERYCY
jgi:hypothetical protein